MPPDGTCPTCGAQIGDPPDTSVPWHFWLLVAGLVIYLGWRYLQGIQWLMGEGMAWLAALIVAATVGATAWWAARRFRRSV